MNFKQTFLWIYIYIVYSIYSAKVIGLKVQTVYSFFFFKKEGISWYDYDEDCTV